MERGLANEYRIEEHAWEGKRVSYQWKRLGKGRLPSCPRFVSFFSKAAKPSSPHTWMRVSSALEMSSMIRRQSSFFTAASGAARAAPVGADLPVDGFRCLIAVVGAGTVVVAGFAVPARINSSFGGYH